MGLDRLARESWGAVRVPEPAAAKPPCFAFSLHVPHLFTLAIRFLLLQVVSRKKTSTVSIAAATVEMSYLMTFVTGATVSPEVGLLLIRILTMLSSKLLLQTIKLRAYAD